ncbi:Cytochrome P450 2J6 [Chionoecetes opilio]|uniref:Cytochrome P450 2J6 n=1 Tax=Chionoecetes opilio TaxID=41210 RepID=A0A8J4XQV3_CHIOP|nr:Cytochrome P450 2J6 [Chionoecetes opilio]
MTIGSCVKVVWPHHLDMWTAVVVLVVTVVGLILFRANKRPAGPPPGPFSLPYIGNALQILRDTPKGAFKKYADAYGGIMSFKSFGVWAVLVSDPALMRTGLADPAASGRIDMHLFRKRDSIIKGRDCPSLGIISSSGDVWRQQRRFTLRTLRDLGFGRNTLEPIMQEELDELLQLLMRRQGEKVDVGLLFNRSIVNVIWAITIGKRYSYDDKKLEALVEKVNKMVQTFSPFHPALRLRWVMKWFPNLPIIRHTLGYMADLLAFIECAMVVLVVFMVQGEGHQVEEGLAGLGRRLQQDAALRGVLEEQVRQCAGAEEGRRKVVARRKAMEGARVALEQEVLVVEGEVAEQQQRVGEAQAQATAVTGTLRGYLQDALTLRQQTERQADAASRRLCEAVTEGRGQLQLLCPQARHSTAPKLD